MSKVLTKPSSFGVEVKMRLLELNMTQRELANDIGVNENYLTDILRGRRSGTKYKTMIRFRLGLDQDDQQKEVI
ncbi:helix-turn-helix domain-containing protein [Paenibacillus sanguinis]|uniref:helix-turn-helix domain-containing protein n=1 Tax=Paenibacillus sanguinis TaxID=225906 RepID=UPI00036EE13C|nr:helix-turn-helix transcriptional regulator [Paenibacillus sanguinis]